MNIIDKRHDLVAFRAAIREWLEKVVPSAETVDRISRTDGEEYERFQRWWMQELDKVGLATPHWPEGQGGAGLGLRHQIVIADEMARAGAPKASMFVVSLNHVPATLFAWGTPEQRAKYLPGVAKGDVWCQGFSEPGAGSDLASLRTRAERSGDEYIINGQKVWSSHSRRAKYCILLARTNAQVKKHAGISFFIMNMRAPGVEVRPIRQANGLSEFSELFLTDVRIPLADRVGEENHGWQVAQSTLASERGLISFSEAEQLRYRLEKVYQQAVETDQAWLRDAQYRREFMRHFARLQAVRRLIRKMLAAHERGDSASPLVPSVIKIAITQFMQDFNRFLTRIQGVQGQLLEPDGASGVSGNPMFRFVESYGRTIAAGTNEIQRNIIAERALGMPRT